MSPGRPHCEVTFLSSSRHKSSMAVAGILRRPPSPKAPLITLFRGSGSGRFGLVPPQRRHQGGGGLLCIREIPAPATNAAKAAPRRLANSSESRPTLIPQALARNCAARAQVAGRPARITWLTVVPPERGARFPDVLRKCFLLPPPAAGAPVHARPKDPPCARAARHPTRAGAGR
jgi:hypothetical protein